MRGVKKHVNTERGTSLIELMIAILVLSVGLLGTAAMTSVSIKSNYRSKDDSTSTAVAKMVLSQISSVPIGGGAVSVTDCANNVWPVNTSGTAAGVGASLTGTGTVDFTQSYANVAAGYAMKYTTCNVVTGINSTYDVRWNIATTPSGKEEFVVVGARLLGTSSGDPQLLAPAVNLRTVVGNQGE